MQTGSLWSLLESVRPGTPAATTVVYECRQCGATVESPDAECPYCERSAIVEHRIE